MYDPHADLDRIADYLLAHGYGARTAVSMVDRTYHALIVACLNDAVPTPDILRQVLDADGHECKDSCPDLEDQP